MLEDGASGAAASAFSVSKGNNATTEILNSSSTPRLLNPPQLHSQSQLRPQKPQAAYIPAPSGPQQSTSCPSASQLSINQCCAPLGATGSPHLERRKMGLSKSNRIILLLAIDSAFFLLELIVGYAVHSLALVADSFHMLNDVLSLCVGLWAVRIANTGSSKMYTYGWQRAETLGALINGVFLVALCLSIFLEAIQRFVEPQVVSNPKLVLIVGCFGLASNVLGLFLFHDHGHGHGEDDEHSQEHDPISNAEEGHSHVHEEEEEMNRIGSQTGKIADELPQSVVRGWHNKKASDVHGHGREFTTSDEDNTTVSGPTSGTPTRKSTVSNGEVHIRRHRRTSGSFGRGFGSVDNIHVHPASFRHDIILASRLEARPEFEPAEEAIFDDDETPPSPNENSELMKYANGSPRKSNKSLNSSPKKRKSTDHRHDTWHTDHHHNQPQDKGDRSGHGHSHGDLNMRGIFLHVMGDALGNIGVIASALFIWLTHFKWRYYVDPGVSLVITAIILTSAIPLCKAASRILLQAVPTGMSIDDIKADIEELPRIISAHHIHVWQLNDTKLVASLHVQVNCAVEGEGSASYMHLAKQIRKCLHGYGIHSSTIQPEFCTPSGNPMEAPRAEDESGTISPKMAGSGQRGSKAASIRSGAGAVCLLDCGDDCADKNQCCRLK